jgi:recombination protein RecA
MFLGSLSVDKQKAIQLAKDQIERQFGKGYIMQLGSRMLVDIPVFSTGRLP